MDQPNQSPEPIDTAERGDYWRVFRERKWIVLLCVVVVVAAAVGVSLRTVPRYRATATVVREGTTLAEAIFGAQVNNNQDPQRALQTSADSVTVEATAQRVKEQLKSARSPGELALMVRAVPSTNADTLLISATGENPQEAADVATAFTRGFIATELEKKKASITLARNVVEGQLRTMTAAEIASPRGALLAERAEQLGVIEQLQTGDYALSRAASVPGTPFSPQPLRNALLGLFMGLVLGVGLAFLLEYLDRRIKDEATMEKQFGVPVLATVPMMGGGWRERRKGRSNRPIGFADKHSPLIESFRTLRSNLQYFGVDKELRTILVTSALPREGKTTVSINLGLGLALSGARVILLEADLRRPMLHTYLKLGNEIGVSNVLAGTHSFAESLQLVRVDDYLPEDTRKEIPSGAEELLLQKNLFCITSGPLPPNPSELVGSAKMQQLLRTAAESADYVIVDAPPLLVAADPVSLAPLVDGVLLTGRLYVTTRDEAKAARELLHRVGAHVIGAVALGGKQSKSYYRRGYYKGYGSYG